MNSDHYIFHKKRKRKSLNVKTNECAWTFSPPSTVVSLHLAISLCLVSVPSLILPFLKVPKDKIRLSAPKTKILMDKIKWAAEKLHHDLFLCAVHNLSLFSWPALRITQFPPYPKKSHRAKTYLLFGFELELRDTTINRGVQVIV